MSGPSSDRGLTRRQLIAGGLGVAAAAATGGGLFRALQQLGREDLVPGAATAVPLQPRRWDTTASHVSFAALGDNGSGGRHAMAVAEQLAHSYRDEPFGHVSLLGDICYYGHIADRFDDVFVKPLGPLIDAEVEFELAVGNHDGGIFFEEGVPDVEATLALLGTPSRYYAVTRGPADFFYLDSGSIERSGPDAGEQLSWLDDALDASEAQWKIVCTHHPVHSSGSHGPTEPLQRVLEPILVRHHVDLVLAGHDHHYERSEPIDGVTHVVSGGGCKLTPVDPGPTTAFARSTLQFMRITIDDDRLSARAVGVDGDAIDRFVLRAREGR